MPERVAPIELKIPSELSFLAPAVYDELVRLGDEHDGGYVVPRQVIRETELLLSFGVGNNWSFDAHFLALNPNLTIHAYDPSISWAHHRDGLGLAIIKLVLGGKIRVNEVRERFRLLRKYSRFFQGKVTHFEERISKYKVGPYDTPLEIVFGRTSSQKLFVKIDIEGAEYKVIDDLVRYSPRILGMVVEFHDTDPLRLIFIEAVQKLRQFYEVVHVHANNFCSVSVDQAPDILEVTLLRRELCKQKQKRLRLPVEGLDSPNEPRRRDYILNFSS